MTRIYISSTYDDLFEYREAAYDALKKLRYDVVAMEDYLAADERPQRATTLRQRASRASCTAPG